MFRDASERTAPRESEMHCESRAYGIGGLTLEGHSFVQTIIGTLWGNFHYVCCLHLDCKIDRDDRRPVDFVTRRRS